jgi:hypothetical protein
VGWQRGPGTMVLVALPRFPYLAVYQEIPACWPARQGLAQGLRFLLGHQERCKAGTSCVSDRLPVQRHDRCFDDHGAVGSGGARVKEVCKMSGIRWLILLLLLVGLSGCFLTKVVTVPMRVGGAVVSVVPVVGNPASDAIDKAADAVDTLPF